MSGPSGPQQANEAESIGYLAQRLSRLGEGDLQEVFRRTVQLRENRDNEKSAVSSYGHGVMGSSPGQVHSGEGGGPDYGLIGYNSQELGLANIDDAMRYQSWHSSQVAAGDQVRDALLMAAKVILRTVPRSPRRTKALNHLIDARMDANCAISFGGRF